MGSATIAKLDQTIASVFPGWGRRRAEARLHGRIAAAGLEALATYEAADKGRTSSDWTARNKSADKAILGDYATLTARARAAVRDDWAAESIVAGHVRHIVGTGITAKANARDFVTGKPLVGFNVNLDRLWKRWASTPALCDVEGKKSFVDFQTLLISEEVTVGQAFVVFCYVPRPNDVGLVLQAIEPEQLDTSITQNRDTGYQIKHGIEIDPYGRTVAIWAYTKEHPYDKMTGDSVRIPADRLVHFMRPRRVRQTHGVTRLAPVLRQLWNRKMFSEYTVLRARFEACCGATIETDPLASPTSILGLKTTGTGTGLTEDRNENKQFNFEPSMIWELPAGKKATFHAPQVPGGQFDPFIKRNVGETAAGVGLDYATVARDYSGGNFSSQRQGLLEVWDETDPEQIRVISLFCQPTRERFIEAAVMEGRLIALEWNHAPQRAAYVETDWRPKAKHWIDPAVQAAAAKMKLEMRLTTRRAIANELDEDWKENITQIHDEEAFAAERNVTLPEAGGNAKVGPREPRPEASMQPASVEVPT